MKANSELHGSTVEEAQGIAARYRKRCIDAEKRVLAWKECPMPLKTIFMAWDGDSMFGPWSPQTEAERNYLQRHFHVTHWLALPPAPFTK